MIQKLFCIEYLKNLIIRNKIVFYRYNFKDLLQILYKKKTESNWVWVWYFDLMKIDIFIKFNIQLNIKFI